METRDHDYLRFTSDWQYESPFFRLPRELRDEIYALALESHIILVNHHLLDFRLTPTHYQAEQTLGDQYVDTFQTRGMPAWIRSCKHICVETVELLGRTRAFEPINLPDEEGFKFGQRGNSRRTRKQNPLLFQRNIVRNILLNPKCARRTRYSDQVRRYQRTGWWGRANLATEALQHIGSDNMSLYTTWSRDWHHICTRHNRFCSDFFNVPGLLPGEPERFCEEWGSAWNGKFRLVQITLQFFAPPTVQDASLHILQAAEALAERLVGDDAQLSLEYLGMLDIGPKEGVWRTRVTAKRMLE